VQAASSGAKKAVTEAKIKVAINGFGRIGRNFVRCWHGRKDSPLEVVVINDTGGVKQASHLLKYDSMLGTFNAVVKVDGNDGISVDGKTIKVVSDRNPLNLPWGYVSEPSLVYSEFRVQVFIREYFAVI
jgi:glyceraldehyde-3-phosphate dehydrogenase (NADP+) (phosphorylating)